jgi:selenocysteine-specific translation elongation factor
VSELPRFVELSERKLKEVGTVTHFFAKIGVSIVELSDALSVGDRILVKGMTTNVEQSVDSMQIEHANVEKAEAGQSIGLKVNDRVREGDTVYRLLT